jgi:hypothetical protein
VVISHSTGALSAADEANLDALRQALGAGLLAELRPVAAGSRPQLDLLERVPLLS